MFFWETSESNNFLLENRLGDQCYILQAVQALRPVQWMTRPYVCGISWSNMEISGLTQSLISLSVCPTPHGFHVSRHTWYLCTITSPMMLQPLHTFV